MTSDRFVRLVKRAPALEALQEEPLDRQDLQETLDVSKPTVHRIAKALDEEGVLHRTGGKYALTQRGSILAEEIVRLDRVVSAADRLAPLLETIDAPGFEIDVAAFADATVTRAEPGSPYRPLERFVSLVEDTDTLRGFDTTTVAPIAVETIYQQIIDGMETEIIYPAEVVMEILAAHPDRGQAVIESENLQLWVHDEVPCGLAVFDDWVGLGGYDAETGALSVFVDTDAPAAQAWAQATFGSFRTEAQSLEPFTT